MLQIIFYYIIIAAWFLYSAFYGDVFNVFESILAIIALLLPVTGEYIVNKKTLDKYKLFFQVSKIILPIILLSVLIFKIYKSLELPIFCKNDNDFKVIVLPFKQLCNFEGKSYDAGFVINERLNDKNLSLKSYYLSNFDISNLTPEKINALQDFHNSDMIVFGSIITEDCSKKGDQICLKFKLKDPNLLQKIIEPTKNEFEKGDLIDLVEGRIQNKMENIILVFSIISQLKKTDDTKLSEYMEENIKILEYENPENTLVLIGDLLYRLGYIGAAGKLYSQAHSLNIKDKMSWNSFGAMMKYNDIFEQFGFVEKSVQEIESFISGVKKNHIIVNEQDTITDERFILTYILAGNDFVKIREYKKAKNCFNIANEYLFKYNNRNNLIHKINIIIGLSACYINLGQIIEAKIKLNELVDISSNSMYEEEFISIIQGFLMLAQLNLLENDFKVAKENLKFVELALNNNHSVLKNSIPLLNLKVSMYEIMYSYYFKQKKNSKALKLLNLALNEQIKLINKDTLNLNSYDRLAELYQSFAQYFKIQNNLNAQEYYHNCCVVIYKKMLSQYNGFGKIEFRYMVSLFNLATIKYELYKDFEASELLFEAKGILKKLKSNGELNLPRSYDLRSIELKIDSLNQSVLKNLK